MVYSLSAETQGELPSSCALSYLNIALQAQGEYALHQAGRLHTCLLIKFRVSWVHAVLCI